MASYTHHSHFLQAVVARFLVHWSIKFPLILAISPWLLLLTFEYWVRRTWLGALLNGRRLP